MKLKDLEHEGTEEFSSFPDRKKVAKQVKRSEKKKKNAEHELKAKLQEAWLNPNNPFLFDGDFDA